MSTSAADNDLRDNLIRTSLSNGKLVKYLTFKGETHTIRQWAEIKEIPVKTLYQRLADGWPIERALNKVPCMSRKYNVVCSDGVVRSLGEAADMIGIARNTVYCRIRRGQTIEQSLTVGRTEIRNQLAIRYRQLNYHYQDLVRLVGLLRRDGGPIPDSWFQDLDNCLDAIWTVRDEMARETSCE